MSSGTNRKNRFRMTFLILAVGMFFPLWETALSAVGLMNVVDSCCEYHQVILNFIFG